MLKQLKEGVRDWLRADDEKQLTEISLEYAFQDLHDATGGFRAESRLGAGAAGAVYRGTLRGGTEVAIKVLQHNGGMNGFEDEVRVLSRFRHPNLVTLLGWGQKNEKEKYLIYELLGGGDVGNRLEKSRNGRAPFPWQQRLRVALDSACGLSHMMNSTPKAFHRDIKPANILLDVGGGAKMADFGLAGTIRDPDGEHIKVDSISGTPGYACPLYIQSGRVSEQSEVYSLGIVLLELLINKPPALAGPEGDIIYPLLQTIQPAAPGAHSRVLTCLDRHAGWPPGNVLDQFAELALSCVDMVPERRPPFQNIVLVLRRLVSAAGGAAALGTATLQMPAAQHQQQAAARPRGGGLASGPLAEVVLKCVRAQGVELSGLAESQRGLAMAVDARSGRWAGQVGRQHQAELFELLVTNKELLSSVSRTHFELSLQSPEGPVFLKKLSGNPLLLDDRPVAQHEAIAIQEGVRIGFTGTSESDPCFLEFRLYLRTQQQVQVEGSHPALLRRGDVRGGQPQLAHAVTGIRSTGSIAGVLECVSTVGGNLAALPPEARAIALPLDEALEVGRSQQVGFFEKLMEADPSWLGFISRTHCRVQLLRGAASPQQASGPLLLKVENLSTNPVFVSGRPLQKGWAETLPEGSTLSFRARGGRDDKETTFIEFRLRRAARSKFT